MSVHEAGWFRDGIVRVCAISSQILGWAPTTFWEATPAELNLALSSPEHGDWVAAPSRSLIEQMMERDTNG